MSSLEKIAARRAELDQIAESLAEVDTEREELGIAERDALIRRWSVRIGIVFLCGLFLAACTDSKPEPPEPVITAQEFEQRLSAHLDRFVTEALDSDAHASKPTSSRATDCSDVPGGGPTWGVVPRAEITVSATEHAVKHFEDTWTWMERNDFREASDEGSEDQVITAVHEDGTHVRMARPVNASQFTIKLTGPCAWPRDRPGGPPSSGRLTALPAPSEPWEALGDDDACRSPQLYVFNSSAPRFAGRAPHPTELIAYSDQHLNADVINYGYFSLPYKWEAHGLDLDKKVQLIVCAYVKATEDTGQDVTCNYTTSLSGSSDGTPHTFDVFESVYRVEVREARTGEMVGEFTMPGTRGGEDNCPVRVEELAEILALGIDEASFRRELEPIIESTP